MDEDQYKMGTLTDTPQNASMLPAPGLVQKRISQMTSMAVSTSSKRPVQAKKRSNQLLAPKPFFNRFQEDVKMPGIDEEGADDGATANKVMSKTPEVPPRSSHSEIEKPALPPKPRNFSASKINKENSNNKENEHNVRSKSVSYPSLPETKEHNEFMQRRRSCSEFQDLIQKKAEIRDRMMKNIALLREEREILVAEKRENEQQLLNMVKLIESKGSSTSEVNKVHQYLNELDQITKLLVSLSVRLHRTNRLLKQKSKDEKKMQILNDKRKRLENQLTEARCLKSNTDRRGKVVSAIMEKYMSQDQMGIFDKRLNELVEKITELKEIDQRVQEGEEQVVALNDQTNGPIIK